MTRNDTFLSLAVNSWINGNRVVWPGADLRGADLRGADPGDAKLSGARVTIGNRTFTLTRETAR
jgi:uncharacterized protein YjbI with pentapeptide repeats